MADCLFCKIAAKEIPADSVYETDTVYAFRDINPQAPTHVLVIPKAHVASVADASDFSMIGDVMTAAAAVAKQEGLSDSGFRLVTNHGEQAGQTVFHWHVHVLGGRPMAWPPG